MKRGIKRPESRHTTLTALQRLSEETNRISSLPQVPGDTGDDLTARQHPNELMRRDLTEMKRLLNKGIDAVPLSTSDAANLRIALGLNTDRKIPERLILCNLRVREAAYRALFEAVKDHWKGPPGTQRRWFFITLITDRGNALEYDTHIDLFRIKRDLNKMLSATKLNAFGMLELQAGTNFPNSENGRTLMMHGHYLGYTDDTKYNNIKTTKFICQKDVLFNWLNAPTANIKQICSLGDMLSKCRYMCKPPIRGHFISPNSLKASGYTLKKTDSDNLLCLRMSEVLSNITVSQAVSAVRGGLLIKAKWMKILKAWHDKYTTFSVIDTAPIYKKYWEKGKTVKIREEVKIQRKIGEDCQQWNKAMEELFSEVNQSLDKHKRGQKTYNEKRRNMKS